MKSIKIDRILEAVAPRVYRAEYRIAHHGHPFVMPTLSDLEELVERMKTEGSYDADNDLALFGVPEVFSPFGEVPAYNYVILDGRLDFSGSGEDGEHPQGKYLWLMWCFQTYKQVAEHLRGRGLTTLFILDDGVYVEAIPQYTLREDGVEMRVSEYVAFYDEDGEKRPWEERAVCIPCLCEVHFNGETYCFLAQALDDVYEHLSSDLLCSMGQPNGFISEKGTVIYEGKDYYFDLKWENGHGTVALKDKMGFLYDPDSCVFIEEN